MTTTQRPDIGPDQLLWRRTKYRLSSATESRSPGRGLRPHDVAPLG